MKSQYFGKKKLYNFLKKKGYKLPKMKDMRYDKYRGSEWLKDSFDEFEAYAVMSTSVTVRKYDYVDKDGALKRKEKSCKV